MVFGPKGLKIWVLRAKGVDQTPSLVEPWENTFVGLTYFKDPSYPLNPRRTSSAIFGSRIR